MCMWSEDFEVRIVKWATKCKCCQFLSNVNTHAYAYVYVNSVQFELDNMNQRNVLGFVKELFVYFCIIDSLSE